MWIRILVLGVALFRLSGNALAHDPGLSVVQGKLLRDSLELTVEFAPADAAEFLPAAERDSVKWTETEFEKVGPRLRSMAPQLWEVRAGAEFLAPREARVQLLAGDNVSFFLVYPRPAGALRLVLRAVNLDELAPGHRQFVTVTDGQRYMLARDLLSAKQPVVEIDLTPVDGPGAPARETKPFSFGAFLKLGVEHIWTGYDHLLFLLALLVVCRSFRSSVIVISCFTLAHSLTLALATLDVINLPSRMTEAVIAASIVYVGVENLARGGREPRGRGALTFVFGLIHGFGFASVLRDLGVGEAAGGIALPLFTFNLGVELGQVAIAAIVLPVFWKLRQSEAFVRRGIPALSALVALAGAYWLLERTVLA